MSNNFPSVSWREQFDQEHKQLRTLLGEAVQSFARRREAVEEAARVLGVISDEVQEHFIEEEKCEGFYDQILEQAPRLQSRADMIRAQHEIFRNKVARLTQTVRRVHDYELWWDKLEKEFHAFSTELMHHESDEAELLQDAYEEDIGSKD